MNSTKEIPYGYCHCGCGEKTKTVTRTDHRRAIKRGDLRRYIAGHQHRLSPVEYIVEDCGYTTPCWNWQRTTSVDGYGKAKRDGKHIRAHRFYYEQKHGKIPDGLELDHLCRNTRCCNPDHLEPVTRVVNARRGAGTKLTQSEVDQIRALGGKMLQREIGELFNINPTTICGILSGKHWRNEKLH